MFTLARVCGSRSRAGLVRPLTTTSGAGAAVVLEPVRVDVATTFVPTLKFTPQDVTAPSHELMLRAGMMRQTGAGLFVLLPLGLGPLSGLICCPDHLPVGRVR